MNDEYNPSPWQKCVEHYCNIFQKYGSDTKQDDDGKGFSTTNDGETRFELEENDAPELFKELDKTTEHRETAS